jgi:hypothetical protein
LAEYQGTMLRVSFALEPAPEDLAALQDVERFRMYRAMIRNRLRDMAQVAFKLTLAQIGAAAFGACFDRYLAARPPRSPLIRDVVADFGPFALADGALLASGPAFLADLLRFEEAKWRVAYAPAQRLVVGEGGVRELDFEGTPLLNPTLRALSLVYSVHTLVDTREPAREPGVDTGESLTPQPLTLLMYRPAAVDEVRWYVAEPFFAALLARAQGGQSLAELVRAVAVEREVALDQALLEALATSLTLAVTRGVLIGVR